MAKTNIMERNSSYSVEAAKFKIGVLSKELQTEHLADKEAELQYWKGILRGIEFAISFGDDFFLLNLVEHLKKRGMKEVANYLKTLVEE